ncbi:hypothetical protein SAMN04489740_2986 [Arthrobacter alpinus]|uniref:Uncharacterized protein n=1 Tax=Arthrobacter alpinus TaxID=656366 RepID=A0A1H5MLX7_9MICC|nr:hypothetical protein [Arthrobacter alpinus]SEE89621.1 hypothetical protein SAMN04489740_2986 [Arthrobacter alpinus]
MNRKKMAMVVLAATIAGALGMSGCATPEIPEASSSTQGTSPAETNETQTSPAETSVLLLLNDSLRDQLGNEYSDSWIEGNKLHVAVTTESAATIVTKAGAIPQVVAFDATALEAALQSVSAWQAKLPKDQAAAIHKIISDGRTGTLTLFVAPEQLDAVAQAAAADNPAGEVGLVIKESTGLATPF